MRRENLVNDGFYHIYNRSVDKQPLFKSDYDRKFFLYNLKRFNKSKQLVDIVCYCLMDNHFHLLLRQKIDGGISKFMQKIGISSTVRYNDISRRTGCIFEGPYKVKEIDNDGYLLHISRYIHLNPLKYLFPDWKVKGVDNVQEAIKYLQNYQWSSYPRLFSKCNNVCNSQSIYDEFDCSEEYDKFLIDWIKYGCPMNIDFGLKI
ncbi:MAG: hypothetical protein UU40_C0003G0035 [Candidatus Uhrbacteria bacterium GW2011_GWD2_41_121]|uniref:Transposase IS200-like domain-containing protein n=1 Tax=Candidatus Uhrbacteria bacterium GW2011_GWC1_41_20 TaxID=1618983 RepID=A0A0G0XS29_9BACT|nr:MAG: hypothetical protein UT52_C0003G0035 [Candidatus Uhrbacteria bacterium GW2011_GWE1_39_46]KKR64295.1 MAG: hypothetical protein UU04_C0003G0035 [Candidatus Uhrbacteria bacterium GW2011_GWC2_40_450]KKR89933.1 MAG: hypothetical protein UU36_C0014G0008 [Candidatus Uhrbacteria bacterium GW2011_GWE2_41_1153]KKR90465.1 MAG: hypothetical protein UU40_C0003G0035 [Candidatus Uhrbacteria bacterium GW2011_GWD2_41_121]KKR96172.1 MAG: hypothetical protein UU46_C0006G0003 [Candidatus Uhrbacteria bacter